MYRGLYRKKCSVRTQGNLPAHHRNLLKRQIIITIIISFKKICLERKEGRDVYQHLTGELEVHSQVIRYDVK